MDVLSPELVWIGNRCYRVNSTQVDEKDSRTPQNGNIPYREEDMYSEEDDDDLDIHEMNNGKYQISYHIPQIFLAQIIGFKGTTKKRIEAETKTQIRIPKQGVEGDVVITGPNRRSVCSARRKIDLIVLAARNKQQMTHFVCVPFTDDTIKESFIKFRDDILSKNIIGIDSELFQNPDKLHLTICTFSLMDNEDRSLAARILHDCKETVILPILRQDEKIKMEIRGLEFMNDDPAAVDVLYAKVKSETMQKIANEIFDQFAANGLTSKKVDNVKMHITLLNSLFKTDTNSNNPFIPNRQTFDARQILAKYKDYFFGVQDLTEIHLSRRFTTANDRFYEATGILKL